MDVDSSMAGQIIKRIKMLERNMERSSVVERPPAALVPGPGAAGEIMTSTGVAWISAPAGGGTLPPTVARGDMLVSDAVPAWSLLSLAGAQYSLLTRDANDPIWSDYYLNITTGKTVTFYHTVSFDGADSKTLTINNTLTLSGTDGHSLTLTTSLINQGANGTINWSGAYILTVPETMTVAGRDVVNTFTREQIINGTTDAIQLTVRGHTTQTNSIVYIYSNDTTNNAIREMIKLENRNSGGVGANGFGSGIAFYAESATSGNYRLQGRITTAWTDATDATYTARLSLWNTTGAANYETFSLVNRSTVRIWYDASNYSDLLVNSGGSLLISPTGDLYLDPTGRDVLPVLSYTINLGSLTKKYLTLHCAELWVETLVAQDVMSTIGGRILVGPTTELTADLASGDTYMTVKHNEMRNADTVYLEANALVEFIRIDGNPLVAADAINDTFTVTGLFTGYYVAGVKIEISGTPAAVNDGIWTVDHSVLSIPNTVIYVVEDVTSNNFAGGYLNWWASDVAGPYNYWTTRNLDGSGANDWSAGDAVFNTGNTGDGFIDLYSVHGVNDAVQYGPTIVGNVRNSTAYADWTERWAIGQLNGTYDYALTTFGVAFGKYAAASSWMGIDATNGIRIMNGVSPATQLAKWDMAGNILIGQVAGGQNNIYISSGIISIRNNATERIGITAAGILTIKDSGGNAVITLDAALGAEITKKLTMPGANSAISIGATPPSSATVGTGIWVDRTGMYGLSANTLQAKFSATDGKITAAAGSVYLDNNGVTINAPAAASPTEIGSYKFYSGGALLGGMGAYTAAARHSIDMVVESVAGKQSYTNIAADSPTTYEAKVTLLATSAATYSAIYVSAEDDAINYIRVTGGALLVGSAPSVAGSDGEIRTGGDIRGGADLYTTLNARIGQGLYVGSLSVAPTSGRVTIEANDAGTNNKTYNIVLTHNSSDTPTTLFGTCILFEAEDSTTEDINQASIAAEWADATHGSTNGRLVLAAYDPSFREGLRIEASGSAPMIGFLGANASLRLAHVANPAGGGTVDAEARTAINSILTTLETFGFHATS